MEVTSKISHCKSSNIALYFTFVGYYIIDSMQCIYNTIIIVMCLYIKGPNEGQENAAYLRGIQQRLINMDSAFSDLEKSGSMLPLTNPAPNSNSMCIPLEPDEKNYEVRLKQIIICSVNLMYRQMFLLVYGVCPKNLLPETIFKRIKMKIIIC